MKTLKTLLLTLLFPAFSLAQCPEHVFFTELHYDNAGADKNEGFELYFAPGISPENFTVFLYNGADGKVYKEIPLSGSPSTLEQSIFYPSSLQNGPDGLALTNQNGKLLHFISYEASFLASDGPAQDLWSQDIGISESSSSPLNWSLQLKGIGSSYRDLHWLLDSSSYNYHDFTLLQDLPLFEAHAKVLNPKTLLLSFSGGYAPETIQVSQIQGLDLESIQALDSFNYLLLLDDSVRENPLVHFSIVDLSTANLTSYPCPIELSYFYSENLNELIISEIHYNPKSSEDLEFIELYNPTDGNISLAHCKLIGAIEQDFTNEDIPSKSTFILYRDSSAFLQHFPKPEHALEWTSGNLSNSGECLFLSNFDGDTVASACFDAGGDWPSEANNGGASLSNRFLKNHAAAASDWFATQVSNSLLPEEKANPGIFEAYIPELRILGHEIINKRQVAVHFNDVLDSQSALTCHLGADLAIASTHIMDSSLILVLEKHLPISTKHVLSIEKIQGLQHRLALSDSIVFAYNPTKPRLFVSEIMYNPPESGSDKYEFIEIINLGYDTAQLAALSFNKGIELSFPELTLAPLSRLLLVADSILMKEKVLSPCPIMQYKGTLSNSGETLSMLNTEGEVVLEQRYDNTKSWPQLADGLGSSLVFESKSGQLSHSQSLWFVDMLPYFASPGADEQKPGQRGGFISSRDSILESHDNFSLNLWKGKNQEMACFWVDIQLSAKQKKELFPLHDFPIPICWSDSGQKSLHLPLPTSSWDSLSFFIAYGQNIIPIDSVFTLHLDKSEDIDVITSIHESAAIESIYFPNPVQEFLHRSARFKYETWILSNLLGKPIIEWKSGEESLDCRSLMPGIYLLRTRENKFIGKISR